MDDSSRYLYQGNTLFYQAKYKEAIDAYNIAIKINPQLYLAHVYKGNAFHILGKYRDAVESFDQALKFDPENIDALMGKGNNLHFLGKYKDAIPCYDQAIKLNPEHIVAHMFKGNQLMHLGRHQDAIACYDKVLELNPQHAEAYTYKANCLNSLNRPQDAQAFLANKGNNSIKNISSVTSDKASNNESTKSNTNTEYDVFISYSWKQKSQAINLYNHLSKQFSCWMDQNEISGGERLFDELVNGLSKSKVIVLCISKAYCESENCKREFHYTMNNKKPYIPLLFCEDKKKEFGSWPPQNAIFFMLADAVYINNVFQNLIGPVAQDSKSLDDLISLIKQKL